jgi:hypothetical protein
MVSRAHSLMGNLKSALDCGVPEHYRELEKKPTCLDTVHQLRTRDTEKRRKMRAYLEQIKNFVGKRISGTVL